MKHCEKTSWHTSLSDRIRELGCTFYSISTPSTYELPAGPIFSNFGLLASHGLNCLQGLFAVISIYWLLMIRVSLVALLAPAAPSSTGKDADHAARDVEAGAKNQPVRNPKLVRFPCHNFVSTHSQRGVLPVTQLCVLVARAVAVCMILLVCCIIATLKHRDCCRLRFYGFVRVFYCSAASWAS